MRKLIMTVDQSAAVRKQVGITLRQYGYEVVEAVDANDALRQLKKVEVDMIITDVELPRLDGIALLRKARALRRGIPVVMLTAPSHEERREEGAEAGATGWIIKPVNPEQVISFARKVLG